MAKWNLRSDGQRTRHADARRAIADRRILVECLARQELVLEKLLADIRATLEKTHEGLVAEARDWVRRDEIGSS